jgi:3-oxoacyl-[acyl-carrier protein] reductase
MRRQSVAIVTGASQGIGSATAIRLARDFEAVVLAARQADELHKTAATVKAAGAEPLTYALDLREPRSVEILVQGTLDRFGRIDVFEMTDAVGRRHVAQVARCAAIDNTRVGGAESF